MIFNIPEPTITQAKRPAPSPVQARPAVPSDLPELLRMARAFHAAGSLSCYPPLDEETFLNTVGALMRGGGVVLVVEGGVGLIGMAAAAAYPTWWNAGAMTGQELFWWVDESMRGTGAGAALIEGLEEWAEGEGLVTFSMVALDKLDPRVGALYRARGYEAAETVYTKGVR